MKLPMRIKKIICKIIIACSIFLVCISFLSFMLLSIFFLLFYIGSNTNIDFIKDITYKINNELSETNYYDLSIIEDKIVLNDGKFIITETNGEFNLIMYTKYNKIQYVLCNAFCWDVLDNKIYIVGDNEYGIIYTDVNKKDKCKILLKSNNDLIYDIINYPEDVIILKDFEEFTENEQEKIINISANGSLFHKF